MTRPKLRPCPTCQTLNKASIKTCTVCYGTLSTKTKFIKKAATLDGKWGQGVVRNRNVNRIIDSARIAVLKLEALGFKPILFYGHRDKKSPNKWVADVMTHFAASSLNKAILDKMRRVYEILLTKDPTFVCLSVFIYLTLPKQNKSQTAEQPQSSSTEQPEQPELQRTAARAATELQRTAARAATELQRTAARAATELQRSSQSSHRAPAHSSQSSHRAPAQSSQSSHRAPAHSSQSSHRAPAHSSQRSQSSLF
ncbi:hypothetical protein F7725_026602 [Dissostichus mawsoni]|uniref:Uncharacterized protein n=1 Tax=Dissostichus mawsoni TaxID=36200 RepID=A0A7J5X8H3_DISMA|nr:hypothetical protein F7725_026602 [Dissostichus mawsoni]